MGETAPGHGEPCSRGTVIDTLLLALSKSQLERLSNEDSLRDLLTIEAADYAGGDALDLQGVWKILSEYPDFDAEAAVAPMCLVKSWEERYRMPVALPDHLRALTAKQVALQTASCRVPSAELTRVFERKHRRAATRVEIDTGPVALQSEKLTWRDRREVAIGAAVVGVLALAFMGYSVASELSAEDWRSIDHNEVSSAIPLRRAETFGDEVAGTLASDDWLKKPAAERRQAMRDTLEALSAENVRVFILMDSKGDIRSTATWYDDPPKAAVQIR